jgi:adenylate cyclase
MNKSLKKLGESMIFWFFGMYLFNIIRYFGLPEEHGIQVSDDVLVMDDKFIYVALLGGIIFGFFHFLVQKITGTSSFRRKSFGQTIVIRGFLYLVILVITGNVLVAISENMFSVDIVVEPLVQTKSFWAFALFFTLMSSLYVFFEIVSEKFGRGILVKMLMGSYRNPKEEDRIFMFIDLKSSTSIAERLGHFTYSKLIQQCFYDLNEAAFKYSGEIYQYVGDEAVISWPYERGVKNNNCIDCFFEFQRKLESRRDYYEKNFEVLPQFKAGLHGGKLIVTEVGIMKKEIAYHGDVINTAARIQEQCNIHKAKLLVSEVLINALDHSALNLNPLGLINLKGKQDSIQLVQVM